MGSRVVVVNTHDAARDLFERRSLIYSDRFADDFGVILMQSLNIFRPNFPMLVDLYARHASFL